MSKRICMIISYDGTNYCGWQIQDNAITVQEIIEKSLNKLTTENIKVIGSSRTDSGVHASCQTVHFDTDSRIPPDRFYLAMNTILPFDIRICDSFEVNKEFHARYSTHDKLYKYRIFNRRYASAIYRNIYYQVASKLDVAIMDKAIKSLEGQHDFSAFQASGGTAKTTVRTIHSANVCSDGEDLITITVSGDGFLYNMVRIIAGTLIEIGLHKRSVDSLNLAIETGNRLELGPTAPSQGLELANVKYNFEKYKKIIAND